MSDYLDDYEFNNLDFIEKIMVYSFITTGLGKFGGKKHQKNQKKNCSLLLG
ncbi:hypothetical protein [Nostoc sp.]|uniref:hypothetical protein n=1 Tax=Nostoc sp. TaxID=1180 RepID=UPI002FF9CDDA